MFTQSLKNIIDEAYTYSITNEQKFILSENLLLSILNNKEVNEFLSSVNSSSIISIKKTMLESINSNSDVSENGNKNVIETFEFKRVIDNLKIHSRNSQQQSNEFDLLISFFKENDSLPKLILEQLGITENIVIEKAANYGRNGDPKPEVELEITSFPLNGEMGNMIEDLLTKLNPEMAKIMNRRTEMNPNHKQNTKENSGKPSFPVLEKFGINLNELAKDGKFDNLIGREEEINRIIQIISKKKKNNPLLLGESGVGKTAVIEGLTQRIVNGLVPDNMKDKIIFSVDTTALVAGTSFRGEFEKNMKMLIEEAKANPQIIMFVDEFHNLFGLGSASEKMDASNILKPYLARGEITVIGATTYEEGGKSIDKDKAMVRRFQKIDIDEPNIDDTFLILKGIKKSYEDFHDIKISDKILKEIVSLSDKHIFDKHFPDKAIDVIDEIGSSRKIKPKDKKTVTINEVVDVISKIAKSPISATNVSEKKMLNSLEKNIKSKLFGQDSAITPVVEQVFMHRAGLIESSKPIGSFLFAGPSGTGKTELARQLAKNLQMNLLRYDMGEYSEDVSVSKLFGSSSGYVGYEEGGILINDVIKNPSSVIVFDEIEKASPKVINSLLQILEEAEATSGNGTKASFQNSIIIFTSNAGAKSHVEKTMGFLNDDGKTKQELDIKSFFPPEFRNRLNEVVIFDSLGKKELSNIVNKFIKEIEVMLGDKNITINVSNEAKEWFGDNGYDVDLGARPMSRLINDNIKKQISKQIISGKIKKDATINVDLKDDEIIIS